MTRCLLLSIAACLALAGCGSAPVQPAWQGTAHMALQVAVEAYLSGNARVADAEMARARSEIARTGQPALLARAELVMCAAHVASLDFDGCPAYEALAGDAAPPERAYAAYLYGRAQAADIALLPEQHRALAVWGESPQGAAAAAPSSAPLAAVADPLAQLVAAGVLLQRSRLAPDAAAIASASASAQGWRRPLLGWLGVQVRAADAAGDRAAAQRLRRQMNLVSGAGNAP